MADEVRYERRGRVALITLNRPRYANAQNSAMTYALDAAFARAVNDDQVAVLVLAGAGDHLFTGGRFTAERAWQVGMVNRVVPRGELEAATFALAEQVAEMPPFGLALAKRAVNQCEDLMGMRPGMDSVFGLHHAAHAHNAEVSGDSLAGLDGRGMKKAAG